MSRAYALVHYMPANIIESWLKPSFKKLVSIDITIWKLVKRFWTLLTTEEVFDEHGSRGAGRRCAGRLEPRAGETSEGKFLRARGFPFLACRVAKQT